MHVRELVTRVNGLTNMQEIIKQLEIARGLAKFYQEQNKENMAEFYKGKVEALEDVLSILGIEE